MGVGLLWLLPLCIVVLTFNTDVLFTWAVVLVQGRAVGAAEVAVGASMDAVLSATGWMLPACAVAVRSAALTMLLCFPGELPAANQDAHELPTETKSRDILIQMRKNANETNMPRPP